MAQQPFAVPPTRRTLETIIRDRFGNPVLVITLEQVMVINPDGSTTELTRSSNIQSVDGVVWSPSLMKGPNPVLLGVCELCRNPPSSVFNPQTPSHGLCCLHNGRICVSCGSFTCPRHRKMCDDNQWRCIPCSKQHRRKNLLRSFFFTREEG